MYSVTGDSETGRRADRGRGADLAPGPSLYKNMRPSEHARRTKNVGRGEIPVILNAAPRV